MKLLTDRMSTLRSQKSEVRKEVGRMTCVLLLFSDDRVLNQDKRDPDNEIKRPVMKTIESIKQAQNYSF